MSIKILVVEDDPELAEILTEILEDEDYSPTWAENGKIAQEKLSQENFDLVISDVQMPVMDGIALLHWTKENKAGTPFIIVSGFSHALETDKSIFEKIDEFISKPFKSEEILNSVRLCLGENSLKADDVGLFVKVPIKEFFHSIKPDFDIFIKLSNENAIKVVNKGENIAHDRLESYIKKGVKHLYIKRMDFQKLIQFHSFMLTAISENDQVDFDKKFQLMRRTGELITEKLSDDNFSEEDFENAKVFAESILNVLADRNDTYQLLQNFADDYIELYTHSIAVSVLSSMIASNLEQPLEYKDKFNISLAAILHDIGKKELSNEIIETPFAQLSHEQRELYKSHVGKSREVLEKIDNVPEEVKKMAHYHHRYKNGDGYPDSLEPKDVSFAMQVLQAANMFCDRFYRLKKHNPVVSQPQSIISAFNERIDKSIIKALKNCFEKQD